MSPLFRGFTLALMSVSVLAVAACGTTGNNMTNQSEANRVDAILERAAREAKASGNKAETVVLLEKIYERNNDDAAVATSFAQALREDEQLNRARQVVFPFTEGKNAYPDAVIELAMIQLALGSYKEAELTSRRAVEMDPKSGRAFLALGTALDAQNYHEPAEVAFRKGIDNWEGDPAPIMNNLALNLAAQNKLDQAIDMLRKAQEISPGRVELERNLRIITTLKESADDFLIKKETKPIRTAPPKAEPAKPDAPKAGEREKPTAAKPATAAPAKTSPDVPAAKPSAKKETKPATAPAKPSSSKASTDKSSTGKTKQAKPRKTDEAEQKNVNSRGSTQQFNKGSGNE